MEKQRLVLIAGPTASGKTALAVKLARRLNGEVISADSMQVYRGMDIGTAKTTKEEMEGVPHHLIDIVNPDEEWNVRLFQQRAKRAVSQITERGRVPIVCGGTGFYLRALLYDAAFDDEEGQPALRKRLERNMERYGEAALHERLAAVDPVSAERIHAHNRKRVLRALEYSLLHGRPFSEYNDEQRKKEPFYDFVFFALDRERSRLYERIDRRVEGMIRRGLVEEVRGLLEKGYDPSLVSMQGLGYKEVVPLIQGTRSLEETVRVIQRDTRHFAKRQLTWFRAEKNVRWVPADEGDTADTLASGLVPEIKKSLNL